MLLGNLVKSTDKNYRHISVKGISFDSRKVKKRDIFFAINGTKTSGNKFVNEAISKGASAIVSNKKILSTGWKPRYSLDNGIIELVKCYKILQTNIYTNI